MFNRESHSVRRAPSLPTWEVIQEPENSSEDGRDPDEGNIASSVPTPAPPSTQPKARPKPRPRFRTSGRLPPSTQPAPSTSTLHDDLRFSKVTRLAMLNIPGKQPANAATSTMSPPTQSASQASKDRPPWNSSAPNALPSSSAQGLSGSSSERPHLPTRLNVGEQSNPTLSSFPGTAIRDRNRPPAQSQPSSSSRPFISSTRPRNVGSISAPRITQAQTTSTASKSKGVGKPMDVIVISDSDDESASVSAPPAAAKTSNQKDAAAKTPIKTVRAQQSFTQQPASTIGSDSDDMPEIISISQRNRNTNQSQTIGGSPDRARANDFPPLSQSLRKVYNNKASVSASREREIKDTAAGLLKTIAADKGKSVAGGEPSASQGPKRPNNREEVLKSGADKLKKKSAGSGAELFRVAHDQPATSINLEPGPSRMLPSTQPMKVNPILAGMRNTATAAKKTKSNLKDSRRVTLPHGAARKTASVIAVSDSEKKTDKDKSRNKDQVGIRREETVIDLCSSDEETPLPSTVPATQSAKTIERPMATHSQSAGPATRPIRPRNPSSLPHTARPGRRVPAMQLGSRRQKHSSASASSSESDASGSSKPGGDIVAKRSSMTSPSKEKPNSHQGEQPDVSNLNTSVSTPSTPRNVPQAATTTETNSFDNDSGNIDDMDYEMRAGDRVEEIGVSLADLETFCDDVHISNSAPDFSHSARENTIISATTPSADVDMVPAGDEQTPERAVPSATDNTTLAEPTSTPIARAERLRSPSVSVQNEEEPGDASEVDLLLGETTIVSPSELVVGTVRLGGVEKSATAEVTQSGGLARNPGTLTDKLEDMELGSPAEALKQATPIGDDVPMVDAKADHISSAKAITSNLSALMHSPSPPSAPSHSTSKISEKQARFNRGVSPEANHVITRNLFGFYNNGQKQASSKPSPTMVNPTSPNPKAVVAEVTSTRVKLPEVIPESSSSSSSDDDDDPASQPLQTPAQSSEASSPTDLYPPLSAPINEESSDTADNHEPSSGDERSASTSSSPKSYGREIVPSPPPRRIILVQTPTSKAAAAAAQDISKGPSPQPSSVAPVSVPTTPDLLKESSNITREFILGIDSEIEEPKIGSGGLNRNMDSYAKSVIPTPRTNVQKAAPVTAKSSELNPTKGHTPYIRRRMEEQMKPSTDALRLISTSIETSEASEVSTSRVVSPEDLKAAGDASDKQSSSPSSTIGTPTPSSPAGSSSSRTTSGPTTLAAPSMRLQVARKTTGKRKPRPAPPTYDPPTSAIDLASPDESSASFSKPIVRKRTRSASSATSDTNKDVENIKPKKRIHPKRRRTDDFIVPSLKTAEVSKSRVATMSGKKHLPRARSSTSSLDQIDMLNGRINNKRGLSPEQVVTPVTDLAEAVSDVAIKDDSYPREVTRFFVERDYGPKWYHVNDIPTDFVNEVNNTPEWCKKPDLLRDMFESAIVQNTAEDEPDAPDIRLVNNVDDEPTPPFEFYYTNRLYHSDTVPPPDYRNLKGCTCIGVCDPNSKICACIKRQSDAFIGTENDHTGFLYDDRGRLLKHEYPIYECNDACGCTEECRNRVVQKGRKCHVNIVKTKDKGWGVNAAKKIKANTFIGIYSGELLDDQEADKRGFVYNRIAKTYLFDLDFFHITQAFGEDINHYCIDAYHVGNFTRFFNHSCDPNCRINAVYINEANIMKPLLCLFSVKNIDVGEELTFSYVGTVDDDTEKPKDGKSYQKCLCGSKKCCGQLFTYGGTTSDEGGD